MGASARIDELRKRYEENPRRFFAPLANEYRKAGDLDEAIDLCRSHLADAPSNLSGQIVYGQALFESGSLDDARAAFTLAVELDPENLIALRHLGDIGRIAGDSETAIGWYQRVLDADPRNEEIAELIQAAQATLIQVPEVPAAPEPLELEPTSLAEVTPEPVVMLEAAPEPEPEPMPVVETLTFEEPATLDPMPDVATLGFDEAEEFAPLTHEVVDDDEPLAPLVPTAFGEVEVEEAPVHVIDIEAAFDDEPLLEMSPMEFTSSDLMSSETAPVAEPAVDAGFGDSAFPDASFDDLGFDTPAAMELPAEEALPPLAVVDEVDFGVVDLPASEATVATDALEWTSWGESSPEPDAPVEDLPGVETLQFDTEPAADAVAERSEEPLSSVVENYGELAEEMTPEPAPFATATMAELYLRQGLRTEAIAVYRQLIEARPDDAGLRAALAAIEAPATAAAPAEQGPTARGFFGALSARRAVPTRTLVDTSAATVLIPAITPATLTQATPAPAVHKPGGALDALFGHGAVSGADEQAAAALAAAFGAAEGGPLGRPSAPAAADLSLDQVFRQSAPTPPRPSLAVPRQSASIRFDQFFASPEPATPEAPAAPTSEAPPLDPGSNDAQFQDWLSGLKRT